MLFSFGIECPFEYTLHLIINGHLTLLWVFRIFAHILSFNEAIMEIKAKLLEKFETAQVSGSFRKREFVVEYADNPQYPECIKFELIQDKCEQLDGFSVGQEINVAFNLKGRKWTNPKGEVVYFNSLQAWRISAANDISATPKSQPDNSMETLTEPEWLSSSSESAADDLPF